jgi:hypothetical protein
LYDITIIWEFILLLLLSWVNYSRICGPAAFMTHSVTSQGLFLKTHCLQRPPSPAGENCSPYLIYLQKKTYIFFQKPTSSTFLKWSFLLKDISPLHTLVNQRPTWFPIHNFVMLIHQPWYGNFILFQYFDANFNWYSHSRFTGANSCMHI